MQLKIIIIFFFSTTTLLSNNNQGKELFKNSDCMSCHIQEDFAKRKNKINNFSKLHKAVTACALGNNANWFDDETLDVTKYLNNEYYKFKNKN